MDSMRVIPSERYKKCFQLYPAPSNEVFRPRRKRLRESRKILGHSNRKRAKN